MFKIVSPENSLSPGADLWIAPAPTSCEGIKKLEWHLSFVYKKSKPSSELLVESSPYVPNRHTLFLCLDKNPESWIKEGYHYWTQLKKPSLRLFIASPLSLESIKSHWPFETLPYKVGVCTVQ